MDSLESRSTILVERLSQEQEVVRDLRDRLSRVEGILYGVLIGLLAVVFVVEARIRRALRRTKSQVRLASSQITDLAASSIKELNAAIAAAKHDAARSRGVTDFVLSGKVHLLNSKPEQAIEAFTHALTLSPDSIDALKGRGLALLKRDKKEARAALEDLEKALALSTDEDPELVMALGRAYLRNRMWSRAVDRFREAQSIGYPNREELELLLADALAHSGNIDASIKAYSRILDENPRSLPATMGLGLIFMKLERYDDTIRLCTSANRALESSRHYALRAQAYAKRDALGDWENATNDLAVAERLAPRDHWVWFARGRLLLHRALASRQDDDLKAAIAALERGLQVASSAHAPMFRNQLCRLYLLTGQEERALDEAKRSVSGANPWIVNYLVLVVTYLSLRQWPDAVKVSQDALGNATDSPARIWLQYFIILGKALQRFTDQDLLPTIRSLVSDLEHSPWFDAEKFDWSHAQAVVQVESARLGPRMCLLLSDLLSALEDPSPAHLGDFRRKWLP